MKKKQDDKFFDEYMQNRKFQLKQQKRKEKHKGHWFCAEKEGDKLMFTQFISFFYLKNSSMLCKIKYITKVMTND